MATSPGDFTGRQKARLQKEAAEQQAEEAQRLTMITADQERAKSDEVVDYTNVEKTRLKPTGPGTQKDPEPVDLSGEAKDEVIDTSRGEVAVAEPVKVERTAVLVRARYDLEQVTIGHGNHYNFEAGRRYRIPEDAAIQLSEREMVDVLQ